MIEDALEMLHFSGRSFLSQQFDRACGRMLQGLETR